MCPGLELLPDSNRMQEEFISQKKEVSLLQEEKKGYTGVF